MTETDLFTPRTESPRTRHDGTGTSSGSKAIIDIDLVLIRLKELSPTPPLACIRKLRGSKQCENSAQTWISLALEIRDSLQSSHELTLWEPTVKQIMHFLHCENHWKQSQHREAVKNIWEGLAPSFKDEFISTVIAFVEWFCIPDRERYAAASNSDTACFSMGNSVTICETLLRSDEPPEILQSNNNTDEHTPIEVDGDIEGVMIQPVTVGNEDTLDGDIYILKHRTITGDSVILVRGA